MKSYVAAATALSLSSIAYAQLAKECPKSDVCYQLNIPANTATTGSGDVFFQISAATSYQWVGLGQGSQMASSNIFVMYASADGKNVTVSPRLGKGEIMPLHDTHAQITLLDGSGVRNGMMIANIKCSNCKTWDGSSMDFSASSASWIYAMRSGSALNSDALDENIDQHEVPGSAFDWRISKGVGGASLNPFLSDAASSSSPSGAAPSGSAVTACTPNPSASSTHTSGSRGSVYYKWNTHKRSDNDCPPGTSPVSDSDTESGDGDDGHDGGSSGVSPTMQQHIPTAHGVLAGLAFVGCFPIGGILMRVASFTGLVWIHVTIQLIGYLIYIAAFGLGIWMAINFKILSYHHPVIGIVLFVILFTQPFFGLVHHVLFKRRGKRTAYSYLHLTIGRVAIILGMINGGLGLQLAGETRSRQIAYAVIAGIVGLTYLATMAYDEVDRRRNIEPDNHEPKLLRDGERVELRNRNT